MPNSTIFSNYNHSQAQHVYPDVFRPDALISRFGIYDSTATLPCNYEAPRVANAAVPMGPICCSDGVSDGANILGIGVNNAMLNYQFGSSMNVPFCGIPIHNDKCAIKGSPTPYDCNACPCRPPGCASLNGTVPPTCDYGFARTHSSIFGPNSGNRNGNVRWG